MSDLGTEDQGSVALEINISHRYKVGHMGVLEFRLRNGTSRIQALDLAVECPCEISRRKSVSVKNLSPSSEKKPLFQFEPARGGEALLEIELITYEQDSPRVYRGQTSVSISAENEGATSPTSFNINIHDIQKLMGNDLSGLLTVAGKELNEDRLRERMERKEALWMQVDLDLDEQESARRRVSRRSIIFVPGGQPPVRAYRALLESLEPSFPRRLFLYSRPEIRFGRNTQKNDVVLRFLPDFYGDERSKTISGEQFYVQYSKAQCLFALAPQGHASTSWDGRAVGRNEQIPLANDSTISIGTHEFALKVSCSPSARDAYWTRSREHIMQEDPGEDSFKDCPYDFVTFSRKTNGEEEVYHWVLRTVCFR